MVPISSSSEISRRFLILSTASFILLGAAVAVSPPFLAIGLALATITGLTLWAAQRTTFPLYLLVATSILLAYRLPLSFVNVTPYRAAILLAFVYLLANVLDQGRQRISSQRFARITAFVLIAAPLIVIYSLNVIRVLPERQAIFKYLSFGVAIATILIFIYFAGSIHRLTRAINAQILSAVFLSIYGLYEVIAQVITGQRPNLPFARFGFEAVVDKRFGSFESTLGLLRAESFLNDSNILAIFLSAALLFCLAHLVEQHSRQNRAFYWWSLFPISLCLLFTLSRSAMVGLGVGLLFILSRRVRFKRNYGYRLIAIGVILLAITFALLYVASPAFQAYLQGFYERFASINLQSRRFQLIAGGVVLFSENMLFGTGVGALEGYGLPSHTTHSSYLTLLAETGIVGGGAFLLFLTPLVLSIGISIRTGITRAAELGIVASMLALLIFEVFYDTLFVSPTSMILLAIGYSHAFWKIKKNRDAMSGVKLEQEREASSAGKEDRDAETVTGHMN